MTVLAHRPSTVSHEEWESISSVELLDGTEWEISLLTDYYLYEDSKNNPSDDSRSDSGKENE
jgi:hypothetical protein